METLTEYLVIEQIRHPKTAQVIASNKFVTADSAYKHYKARPNTAFTRHGDTDSGGLQVYYKIKVLKGIRAIKKHKKMIKAYNTLK